MTEALDNESPPILERRRKLLPRWIKVFLWIFMVFGVISPIGLVFGLFEINFQLALYGIETINPLSITGLTIILLFAIKGAVSYGLWTEKDWAISLAIMDSIIGIIACLLVMFVLPFFIEHNGFTFSLRLELLVLIPYFLKMKKIKTEWETRK